MHVVECDVPSSSVLSRDLIRTAHFHDSYRAKLARPELGIVDIFFALFGHTPLWMKVLLIVRKHPVSNAETMPRENCRPRPITKADLLWGVQ
jgi:hypothetical protein